MPHNPLSHFDGQLSSYRLAHVPHATGTTWIEVRRYYGPGNDCETFLLDPNDIPDLVEALQVVHKAMLIESPVLAKADHHRLALASEISRRAHLLREAHFKMVPLDDLVMRFKIPRQQVIAELRAQGLDVDESYTSRPTPRTPRRQPKKRR